MDQSLSFFFCNIWWLDICHSSLMLAIFISSIAHGEEIKESKDSCLFKRLQNILAFLITQLLEDDDDDDDSDCENLDVSTDNILWEGHGEKNCYPTNIKKKNYISFCRSALCLVVLLTFHTK